MRSDIVDVTRKHVTQVSLTTFYYLIKYIIFNRSCSLRASEKSFRMRRRVASLQIYGPSYKMFVEVTTRWAIILFPMGLHLPMHSAWTTHWTPQRTHWRSLRVDFSHSVCRQVVFHPKWGLRNICEVKSQLAFDSHVLESSKTYHEIWKVGHPWPQ